MHDVIWFGHTLTALLVIIFYVLVSFCRFFSHIPSSVVYGGVFEGILVCVCVYVLHSLVDSVLTV